MPQTTQTESDAILALYKAIDALSHQVRQLQNRKVYLPIRGSNIIQDGDGGAWIDNDDNKIHYVINGIERTISHD